MEELIQIKPHHFIDIITQVGEGKKEWEPVPIGHHVHLIAKKVLENHNIILEIELGADDICQPCVHNVDGLCDDNISTKDRPGAPSSKREWNLIIDKRWCERLKIKQGDRISASDFLVLVNKRMRDITDIYREMSSEHTAERSAKLKAGIREYTSQS